MRFPDKAADALRDYGVDWARFLRDRTPGTTLLSVSWRSDPEGLSFTNQRLDGSKVRVMIGAGSAGVGYQVVIGATLSNGELEERAIPLQVVRYKRV